MGFVNSSDRLTQMNRHETHVAGRLSGNGGRIRSGHRRPSCVPVNLSRAARLLFEEMPSDKKSLLASYAEGVNAYIESFGGNLPPELAMAGYDPGPLEPLDS
jgi:penicillin amidase